MVEEVEITRTKWLQKPSTNRGSNLGKIPMTSDGPSIL